MPVSLPTVGQREVQLADGLIRRPNGRRFMAPKIVRGLRHVGTGVF